MLYYRNVWEKKRANWWTHKAFKHRDELMLYVEGVSKLGAIFSIYGVDWVSTSYHITLGMENICIGITLSYPYSSRSSSECLFFNNLHLVISWNVSFSATIKSWAYGLQ